MQEITTVWQKSVLRSASLLDHARPILILTVQFLVFRDNKVTVLQSTGASLSLALSLALSLYIEL